MDKKIDNENIHIDDPVPVTELTLDELAIHILQAPMIAAIEDALSGDLELEQAVNLRMARHLLNWNESYTIH